MLMLFMFVQNFLLKYFEIHQIRISKSDGHKIICTFVILGGYTSEPEVTSYSVFAGKPTGINGENG